MKFARARVSLLLPALLLLSACVQAEGAFDSLPAVTPTAQSEIFPTITVSAPQKIIPTDPAQVFLGPLSVILTNPLDNSTVNDSVVKISGQADSGTTISINDEVILVDDRRLFSIPVTLEPGMNLIEITASDANNNQGFSYLTVFYEPQSQ